MMMYNFKPGSSENQIVRKRELNNIASYTISSCKRFLTAVNVHD